MIPVYYVKFKCSKMRKIFGKVRINITHNIHFDYNYLCNDVKEQEHSVEM